ncbi:hypothetical protein SHKM778_19360 [Streptomyces sp. KM77-8]|uniref:Adenosine deaminase domain-containing protein n=1 Tax=Streptomyces haneummycinicus TaxID=3074435 RepID=A0AAT9HDQ6_9ACTN
MTHRIPGLSRRTRTAAATGLSALALLSSPAVLPAAHADAPAADRTARQSSRPLTGSEAATAARLDAIRDDPRLAEDFFRRLPKGGDLHNHLSGAVRTEYLVELAAEDGLCIDTATTTAVAPPCGDGTRPAADARTDRAFHDAIVRAWSMQDFPADGNGHDHFFDTFGKFGEVTWRHRGNCSPRSPTTSPRSTSSTWRPWSPRPPTGRGTSPRRSAGTRTWPGCTRS